MDFLRLFPGALGERERDYFCVWLGTIGRPPRLTLDRPIRFGVGSTAVTP